MTNQRLLEKKNLLEVSIHLPTPSPTPSSTTTHSPTSTTHGPTTTAQGEPTNAVAGADRCLQTISIGLVAFLVTLVLA